jgi:hypothetical protein
VLERLVIPEGLGERSAIAELENVAVRLVGFSAVDVAQNHFKKAMLREALIRTGGVTGPGSCGGTDRPTSPSLTLRLAELSDLPAVVAY